MDRMNHAGLFLEHSPRTRILPHQAGRKTQADQAHYEPTLRELEKSGEETRVKNYQSRHSYKRRLFTIVVTAAGGESSNGIAERIFPVRGETGANLTSLRGGVL